MATNEAIIRKAFAHLADGTAITMYLRSGHTVSATYTAAGVKGTLDSDTSFVLFQNAGSRVLFPLEEIIGLSAA